MQKLGRRAFCLPGSGTPSARNNKMEEQHKITSLRQSTQRSGDRTLPVTVITIGDELNIVV